MKRFTYPHAAVTTLAIVSLGVAAIMAYTVVALLLQPKGHLTCGSFGSYADAVASLAAGNTQLDRDHDGEPCEDLKKKP
jgi:hypothetical protein